MSQFLTAAVCLGLLSGCTAATPRPPHWACARVAAELIGPEDFALDTAGPSGPRLIVSARAGRPTDVSTKNGIWSVSVRDPKAAPVLLKVRGERTSDCTIQAPHGIALATRVEDKPLGVRLFVINERSCLDQDNPCSCASGIGGYSIERYLVDGDDGLVFEERYSNELLVKPNDLDVNADGTEFYVSNAQASSSEFLRNVELLFQIPCANVVRWSRPRPGRAVWTIADGGLNYANGVALDQERNRLYVSEFYRNWLRVYDIKRSCRACGDRLVRVGVIRIGSGPDNLTFGNPEKTQLYVAAHSSVWQFTRHYSAHRPSPSEAYLVDDLDHVPSTRLVYADDGTDFSAASTALEHDRRLFLGEVLDGGLLVCTPASAASDVDLTRWHGSADRSPQ